MGERACSDPQRASGQILLGEALRSQAAGSAAAGLPIENHGLISPTRRHCKDASTAGPAAYPLAGLPGCLAAPAQVRRQRMLRAQCDARRQRGAESATDPIRVEQAQPTERTRPPSRNSSGRRSRSHW